MSKVAIGRARLSILTTAATTLRKESVNGRNWSRAPFDPHVGTGQGEGRPSYKSQLVARLSILTITRHMHSPHFHKCRNWSRAPFDPDQERNVLVLRTLQRSRNWSRAPFDPHAG